MLRTNPSTCMSRFGMRGGIFTEATPVSAGISRYTKYRRATLPVGSRGAPIARWETPSLQLNMDRRIRVLVAKPGLDGHDRGAKVIARALRDAGMEVIYTGLRQTPEMIVNAALQEDVQAIGLSILSGAHNAIVPRVMELLKEKHMDDVIVLVGGIIPDEDAEQLKRLGVAAVFQPGASLEAIVDFIRRKAPQPGSPLTGAPTEADAAGSQEYTGAPDQAPGAVR
jgi:methylmalonyl-CoA mutase, C-terminal domain